jgi:hypothetical protein
VPDVWKIMRGRWKSLRTSWSTCFLYGHGHIISHICVTFLNLGIVVVYLIISEGYLVYIMCTGLRFFALINGMHYYKKNFERQYKNTF